MGEIGDILKALSEATPIQVLVAALVFLNTITIGVMKFREDRKSEFFRLVTANAQLLQGINDSLRDERGRQEQDIRDLRHELGQLRDLETSCRVKLQQCTDDNIQLNRRIRELAKIVENTPIPGHKPKRQHRHRS